MSTTLESRKFEVVNYSDKSFAILGTTKEDTDLHAKFKEIGGVFNKNLKCGAGWIFSKRHLQEVKAALGILAMVLLCLFISPTGATAQTCGALTKAGTHCMRKVEKEGMKCWQHGGQVKAAKTLTATTISTTCGAPTKNGGKCKNRVKNGGRCYLHKGKG